MTSAAKLKCPSNNIGAMPVSQARAGRERGHVSLSPPSGRPSLSLLVSTFTHRVHRAPVPRGHRQFTGKAEWR